MVKPFTSEGVIFLVDTGKIGKTGPLVNHFLEQMRFKDYENIFKTAAIYIYGFRVQHQVALLEYMELTRLQTPDGGRAKRLFQFFLGHPGGTRGNYQA